MNRQSSIYHPYQRVVALIICIAMLASYFPKQVWDILFSPAYAAPLTTMPLETSITPISAAASPLGMTNSVGEMLQSAELPEEFEHLSQIGLLTPNGEPNGMLMDVSAIPSAMQEQPPSLINPLSVSRVQSGYRAVETISNTLVITFTVTNNRPPALTPPTLPVSATITDTIETVSAIDFENDPNTIRNVLLTNELTSLESFVEASHPADRKGTQLAFNLGHIAPLSSVSMTLSIEVPSNVADFTELDSGAKVWGTLQSRMVEAQAYPATLAPNTIDGQPIGEWLKWTVDADFYDEYMLEKAAELGQEPIAMFEYVRSLGYESYKGSLRGTRGTLWSEAGNSLDQASLLIAMLRASGIPARYRHGSLETAQAQELILSMFPEPTQVIGHIPAGAEVSDPANDPQLLDETQDHWWVEAYIPDSGWQDLDPSFASAVIGQSFVPAGNVAIDGTNRIAEVPDSLRHKVTIKVKVETFYSLSSLNGGLPVTYPLTATFNAVELVGEPVTLRHLVNSSNDGGLFGWYQFTYTPYLTIRKNLIKGQPYQELNPISPLAISL